MLLHYHNHVHTSFRSAGHHSPGCRIYHWICRVLQLRYHLRTHELGLPLWAAQPAEEHVQGLSTRSSRLHSHPHHHRRIDGLLPLSCWRLSRSRLCRRLSGTAQGCASFSCSASSWRGSGIASPTSHLPGSLPSPEGIDSSMLMVLQKGGAVVPPGAVSIVHVVDVINEPPCLYCNAQWNNIRYGAATLTLAAHPLARAGAACQEEHRGLRP